MIFLVTVRILVDAQGVGGLGASIDMFMLLCEFSLHNHIKVSKLIVSHLNCGGGGESIPCLLP